MNAVDLPAILYENTPVVELIIRGTAVYWFLYFLFRFTKHRETGALNITDLVVLVIIADAAQNAMAGEYTTVLGGAILVSTIVGWSLFFDWLSFKFPRFRRFLQPRVVRLIKDGRVVKPNLRREFITEDELLSEIRAQGNESVADVKHAYLESDGRISVIPYSRKEKSS